MEGLYEAANSSASVMGGEYIGSKSALEPRMIFAYRGVGHISGRR
jgi:hypothetical protein